MGKALVIKNANFSANAVDVITPQDYELQTISFPLLADGGIWNGDIGGTASVQPTENYSRSSQIQYYVGSVEVYGTSLGVNATYVLAMSENGIILAKYLATGVGNNDITFTPPSGTSYLLVNKAKTDASTSVYIKLMRPIS